MNSSHDHEHLSAVPRRRAGWRPWLNAAQSPPCTRADAGRGMLVRLGGVEGSFVLPDPPPRRLLFISAGSGITPIMSMLRSLCASDRLQDVVHLHSERTVEAVIFAAELHALDRRHRGYRL